jgi:Ca2+-binding EF-hand superfamily protein
MRWLILGILALALLAPPAAAWARISHQQANELHTTASKFSEADANGDGRVSRDEFMRYFFKGGHPSAAYFEYRFRARDRDGDGFLSQWEFLTRTTRPEEFRGMDKNGDGKISRDEFIWGEEMFQRFDRNRDGFVSLSEYMNPPPAPRPKKGEKMY